MRPDTTWERIPEADFYVPGSVDTISAAPVLCARICRLGKCVGAKFARRYFDGVGRGLLLYPESLVESGPEGFAAACCVDRTSHFPLPEENPDSLAEADRDLLCRALEQASANCRVRTGDFLCVETGPRTVLCKREGAENEVHAQGCDFRIIF